MELIEGPVGAKLARDGGVSETWMLTDTPLSRASFAPTGRSFASSAISGWRARSSPPQAWPMSGG
ncbi:hypothetical protein C1C98_15350 [Pseudomonas ogarae]|uniref:Uncharacterized protein n=1 Tax=Pseudomonas ogarae (strain DSM 112162 / CECT 30235 / F113) TaxID=1114970 RepID=A0ABN5G803_PSEO1|nr:hypothetical protein C1C98_15350 [Pseudomonas ogarae]